MKHRFTTSRLPALATLLAWVALLGLAAAILSGCGGDDEDKNKNKDNPPQAAPPAASETEDEAQPQREMLRLKLAGVRDLAYSPDGARLALAGADGIWLYTADLEPIRLLEGHDDTVRAVEWSPDGTRLASGSLDETVRLWDAESGEKLATLKGHMNWITSVAWSPDGTHLASAGIDKTVRLWDVASGAQLVVLGGYKVEGFTIEINDEETSTTFKFVDEEFISEVSTLDDQEVVGKVEDIIKNEDVHLLDRDGGDLFGELKEGEYSISVNRVGSHANSVTAVDWSPDGTRLASASTDGVVKLWDTTSHEQLAEIEAHTDSITSVAWSPNGAYLASAGWDRVVSIWDAESYEPLAVLQGPEEGAFTSLAWSPDSTHIASGSRDNTVWVWEVTGGEPLSHVEGHGKDVLALAWSPDGTRLVSAGQDGTVRLWDAAALIEGE